MQKPGKWFLARAATLHLHYAEAANRAGKHRVAYALVNKGIAYTYDPAPGNSVSANRDVTNFHQTFLPWPYDFDARGVKRQLIEIRGIETLVLEVELI